MILESSTFIHTLESIDLCEATRYRNFPKEKKTQIAETSHLLILMEFCIRISFHIFSHPEKKIDAMCCNEKMRAHHVNHKIQKNLHFVIHFFNILFFHNRKVCMQQVVFIMTFLMRQQQMKIPWRLWVFFLIMYPITTNLFKPPQQYYTIALLERSPLVPHTQYLGVGHHQSNKICEDEKGKPRRLASDLKIIDSHLPSDWPKYHYYHTTYLYERPFLVQSRL